METLYVSPTLSIPLSELRFKFRRSSGPGGQNVNKLNTSVELQFDFVHSAVFSDEQRQRIAKKLAARLNSTGALVDPVRAISHAGTQSRRLPRQTGRPARRGAQDAAQTQKNQARPRCSSPSPRQQAASFREKKEPPNAFGLNVWPYWCVKR